MEKAQPVSPISIIYINMLSSLTLNHELVLVGWAVEQIDNTEAE